VVNVGSVQTVEVVLLRLALALVLLEASHILVVEPDQSVTYLEEDEAAQEPLQLIHELIL